MTRTRRRTPGARTVVVRFGVTEGASDPNNERIPPPSCMHSLYCYHIAPPPLGVGPAAAPRAGQRRKLWPAMDISMTTLSTRYNSDDIILRVDGGEASIIYNYDVAGEDGVRNKVGVPDDMHGGPPHTHTHTHVIYASTN